MDIKSSLFGQLAIRAGLVTQEQVDECLKLQQRYRDSGKPVPKLGEILAAKQYLSPEQVKAILQGKFAGPGRRFGEICVQMKFASLEQVKECLEEQRELEKKGPAPRLGMILAKRGRMKPHQITAVLEAQGVEVLRCAKCDLYYNVASNSPANVRKCSSCGGELTAPPEPPPIDYDDGTEVEEAEAGIEEALAGGEEELEEIGSVEGFGEAEGVEAEAGAEPAAAAVAGAPGAGVMQPEAAARAKTAQVPAVGPVEAVQPVSELTEIGGYRVLERIGADAQGVLFTAEHETKGTRVALRVVDETRTREVEFYRAFSEQAKRAASLRHPGIKRIISAGRDKGHLYHASEFVEGKSLRNILASDGHLPVKVAVKIARDVAAALAHGHSQGIIHGEIKPSNILVQPDGVVKLAGFGLYRDPMANIEMLTRNFGVTPFYLAPEQAMTEPREDSRTDIYSLGAVLYHALTGRPPYEGNSSLEVMMRLTEEDLAPPHAVNSSIPEELSAIVTKMMAAEPKARYQSVEAVMEDLNRLLGAGRGPERAQTRGLPEHETESMPAMGARSAALERESQEAETITYPVGEATAEGFSNQEAQAVRAMVRSNLPEQLPRFGKKKRRKERRAAAAGGGRRESRGRDDRDDGDRRRERPKRDNRDDRDDDDRRQRGPVKKTDNTTVIGLIVAAVFIVAALIAVYLIVQRQREMEEEKQQQQTEREQRRRETIKQYSQPSEEKKEEVPEDQRPRSAFDFGPPGGGGSKQ